MKIEYIPAKKNNETNQLEQGAEAELKAHYSLRIDCQERKVIWEFYLPLPKGMHWKKGDELGLGATHHEKTQSFEEFLNEPFRALPEDLNFVKEYVRCLPDFSGVAGHLPQLRYTGFPPGGSEIWYKTTTDSHGNHITYYVSPHPYEKVVRWSYFSHLPEENCAKKRDESQLGMMQSDGMQTFAEFKESPKYEIPEVVKAMVAGMMNY